MTVLDGEIMSLDIFYPLFVIATVCLGFKFMISRQGNKRQHEMDQFIQDERESNFARAKPIPEELVVHVNAAFLNQPDFITYPEELPAHTLDILEKLRTNTYQKSLTYMVRLDKSQTNLELKTAYGVGNLDRLIAGDQNLYTYLHALNSYAEILIKYQWVSQAKQVLQHALEDVQSDIIKTHELWQSL